MAKRMEGEDAYAFLDRLLEEQQMKHFELAGLVGEYRNHFADMEERATQDAVNLARGLPGAKYRVNAKFIEENWLVFEAEMKRMFPRD